MITGADNDRPVSLNALEIALPHPTDLFYIHHQPSARLGDIVAQHQRAAHPFAPAPSRGHLVSGAILDQMFFKFCEGQKDVERKPAQ
jgi:hypothetical protein